MEHAGPVPEDVDDRVVRRDTSSLADGVLVRYQRIGLEKSPARNFRWELHADGTWFLARHSGDTEDWRTPFDTDLPDEPTAVLPADVVEEVRTALAEEGFAGKAPYQRGVTAKGGGVTAVRAVVDGEEHEVLYDNAETPLLELLGTIDWQHEPS